VCLPVVMKEARVVGEAAIEITHVRNPEIRNLATNEENAAEAGAGVLLSAGAVRVTARVMAAGATAAEKVATMVIVKRMVDRNTWRSNYYSLPHKG